MQLQALVAGTSCTTCRYILQLLETERANAAQARTQANPYANQSSAGYMYVPPNAYQYGQQAPQYGQQAPQYGQPAPQYGPQYPQGPTLSWAEMASRPQ